MPDNFTLVGFTAGAEWVDAALSVLDPALVQADTEGPVGLLYIGIDEFEAITESLGHERRAKLLLAIQDRLVSLVQGTGTVIYLDGGQFAVLQPGVPDALHASDIAERCVNTLRAPFDLDDDGTRRWRRRGQRVSVTPTVGIAVRDKGDGDVRDLLRDAEEAMTVAEQANASASRYQVFTAGLKEAHNPRLHARLELGRELRRAVENDELSLRYQPMVECASGRLAGVEASVYWDHPTRGTVQLDESYSVITELSEPCIPLSRWVLEKACAQAKEWRGAGHRLSVAVGISGSDLELAGSVALLLQSAGLEGSDLELVLSGTTILGDYRRHLGALPLRLLRHVELNYPDLARRIREGPAVGAGSLISVLEESGFAAILNRDLVANPSTFDWGALNPTGPAQPLAHAAFTSLADIGVARWIDNWPNFLLGLNYVDQLPVSGVKIPQGFVHALDNSTGPEHSSSAWAQVAPTQFVAAIIDAAHSRGMQVAAHGVKTEEEFMFLKERGCDQVQGPLFGDPVPAAELPLDRPA